MKARFNPLFLLPLLPGALAWGSLGHMTVGIIAQSFLTPSAEKWAQSLLGSTNSTYLASVAPWADFYRTTKAGAFSEPFHFIDAQDNPPTSCNLQFNRDCGNTGCLVSAITNYTSRVQNTTLPAASRAEALKFLIHFLGDITQPLHAEGIARGGNEIAVSFGSTAMFRSATNLHHVWDDNMLEKLVGGNSLADAMRWGASLTADIQNGLYVKEKAAWVVGMDVRNASASATAWAQDTNVLVCSVVLKEGVKAIQAADLSKDYYTAAVPVFSRQIAKGGYRLATWLNLLAAAESEGLALNDDSTQRHHEL